MRSEISIVWSKECGSSRVLRMGWKITTEEFFVETAFLSNICVKGVAYASHSGVAFGLSMEHFPEYQEATGKAMPYRVVWLLPMFRFQETKKAGVLAWAVCGGLLGVSCH